MKFVLIHKSVYDMLGSTLQHFDTEKLNLYTKISNQYEARQLYLRPYGYINIKVVEIFPVYFPLKIAHDKG